MRELSKVMGENTLIRLGDSPTREIPVQDSGSDKLNDALGGGYAKGRIIEIYGGESSGKAQPLGAKVLTPYGYTTIGKIKRGDRVLTPKGKVVPVDGVYPQGKRLVYTIRTNDGSSTEASGEHLWTVKNLNTGKIETLSTEQLNVRGGRYALPKLYPLSFRNVLPDNYMSLLKAIIDGLVAVGDNVTTELAFVDISQQDIIEKEILKVSSVSYDDVNTMTVVAPNKDTAKLYTLIMRSRGYFVKQFGEIVEVFHIANEQDRIITDIEYEGELNCVCIKIRDEEELYITNDLIPTHNTTLALHAVKGVIASGKRAAFIDMEHALNVSYAKDLGVAVEELYLAQPTTAEEALDLTDRLVNSALFDIVIVDSVAALVPKRELEGDSGDAVMGLQARLMSQALRKLTGGAAKTGTTIIFINQTREKIVTWGNPVTTSGGNALKFYASQRVEVGKGQPIKDGDTQIGHELRVKVIKNKVAPPYKNTTLNLMYGKPFNREEEVVERALSQEVLTRKGSFIYFEETRLGQGLANAIQTLADNPELLEIIKSKMA